MAFRDTAQGLLGGLHRFSNGVSGLLFPGMEATGVDPRVAQAAKAQAMMSLGMGLLGGNDVGKAYSAGQISGWEPIEQARREAVMRAAAADRESEIQHREWQRQQAEVAAERQKALDYENTRRYNRESMGRRFENEAEQKRWEADHALRQDSANRQWAQERRLTQSLLPDSSPTAQPGAPRKPIPVESATKQSAMEEALRGSFSAQQQYAAIPETDRTKFLVSAAANLPKSAGREFRQKMRFSIEAGLRAMTGAAAPEAEVDRYFDMFMPSPFDGEPARAEKFARFDRWITEALTKSQGVEYQAAPTSEGIGPETGTVEGGYRFKGGDPSNPNNWEPVR